MNSCGCYYNPHTVEGGSGAIRRVGAGRNCWVIDEPVAYLGEQITDDVEAFGRSLGMPEECVARMGTFFSVPP